MKHEANFWNRIVDAIWLPTRKLDRIENGVGVGMPDSYYCLEGRPGWMELKAPEEPVRGSSVLFANNHKLSLAQRNWLRANRQAGGRGFVAVESTNWVFLVGARNADFVNRWSTNEFVQFADFRSPRPLDAASWHLFVSTLKKDPL